MAKIYDLAEERKTRRGTHTTRLTITDSVTQTPPYWLNPDAGEKIRFPADWVSDWSASGEPTSL